MAEYVSQTKQQHKDTQGVATIQRHKQLAQFEDNRCGDTDGFGRVQLQRAINQSLMQKQARPSGVIQLAVVNPVITGATKATRVTLNLAAGDNVPQGSVPAVDSDGWAALQALKLTLATNKNPRKWVRFHALNEHAGGPGDDQGNLTSTTAKANHLDTWAAFETNVKNAIPDAGANAAQSADFQVDIGYPGAALTHWTSQWGHFQTTDAADYPQTVIGTLSVGGVVQPGVNLNGAADGLYGPEHFQKIPHWKRKNAANRPYGPVGTDTHVGAVNWS